MEPKRICNGTCKRFRVRKPTGQGRYSAGQARCQQCDIWIDHHGAHTKDGSAAAVNSEGWFCNCCNYRVRRSPRSTEYKAKARFTAVSQDGSDIDLSYITKRRVRMIKYIARCIPPHRDDFDRQEFEDSLKKHATYVSSAKSSGRLSDELEGSVRKRAISISSIEQEFNAPIEMIVDLAYEETPPNKIFMVVELELACSVLGYVPTKQEFEERRSALRMSQYEDEFGSWERLLERLGYDPFYRDRKGSGKSTGKDTTDTDSSIDATKQRYSEKQPPDDTSTETLNRRIGEALHLIKYSPGGAYLSDLKRLLGVSQEEMSGIVTRLIRVDGVSRKEILYGGVLQDILLKYNADVAAQDERDGQTDKSEPKDGVLVQRNDPYTARLSPTRTDQTAPQDMDSLTCQMIDKYVANKGQIQKHLRQRLTKEFVRSGSMESIFKNNPEFTREEVKRHVITDLRLPKELQKLENEGALHVDPECSLHIALFAVNYHDWDGKKDGEAAVTMMAQSMSKHVHQNPDLNRVFSGKAGSDGIDSIGSRQAGNNENGVTAATAVWIATATLHRIYGINRIFSNRDIVGKIKEQGLCVANKSTLEIHISGHCVANTRAQPYTHRKLYRVSRGRYRLYRDGDYCNPGRKHGPKEPHASKVPDRYRDLLDWYREEYCK